MEISKHSVEKNRLREVKTEQRRVGGVFELFLRQTIHVIWFYLSPQ